MVKKKKKTTNKSNKKNAKQQQNSIVNVIYFLLFFALSVFIFLSSLEYCGSVGVFIKNSLLSLFGSFGYFFPALTLFIGIVYLLIYGKRYIHIVSFFLLYVSIISLVSAYIDNIDYQNEFMQVIKECQDLAFNHFSFDRLHFSAGIISTTINYFLYQFINRAGLLVFHIFFVVLFFLLVFGFNGVYFIKNIIFKILFFIPNSILDIIKTMDDDKVINYENEQRLSQILERQKINKTNRKKNSSLDSDDTIVGKNFSKKDTLVDVNKDLSKTKIIEPQKFVYNTDRINVDVENIQSRFFRLNDKDIKSNSLTFDKKDLLNEMKKKSINEIMQDNKDLQSNDFFFTKNKHNSISGSIDDNKQYNNIDAVDNYFNNNVAINNHPNKLIEDNDIDTDIGVDEYVDINREESLSIENDFNERVESVVKSKEDAQVEQQVKRTLNRTIKKKYKFPPLYLLTKSEKQKVEDKENLKKTAQVLQGTLEQFGVGAKVTHISVGPTVTRYELLPNQGVRVKKFLDLQDDIKLAMAATDIRIEAPIPGKQAIGIEIPNKVVRSVLVGDLLSSSDFRNSESKLTVAIGKDISGKTILCDISKLPHLLVAGSTGSGKSVCINSIIMSIIYKASPEDVRLILVDPKVVELQIYNDIPHLLVPVVTDPKRAASALNWAVKEMMDRYNLIVKEQLRNIDDYNDYVDKKNASVENEDEKIEKLPKIVIIIDEFADLMMVASKDVENAIFRIAQLARACGIYLIIATQRPSVNVISGSIKANVPGRIAFAVSSGVDSKTIIDQYGAEKLLGKGDMLYYPTGIPKPIRVQGCFVSDEEIKRVVKFIKNPVASYNDEIDRQITEGTSFDEKNHNETSANGLDDYFVEAGKLIIQAKTASSGFLQRKLQIGFNRASRILDQLAENCVVSEQDGKKPREILMEYEEFLNKFGN